jgi:hypothetical protein
MLLFVFVAAVVFEIPKMQCNMLSLKHAPHSLLLDMLYREYFVDFVLFSLSSSIVQTWARRRRILTLS